MHASEAASPNLPHFSGISWRLDVPRASRASASNPQSTDSGGSSSSSSSGGSGVTPYPVYSIRLSLAHLTPSHFSASPSLSETNKKEEENQQDEEEHEQEHNNNSNSNNVASPPVDAKLEEVSFSCTPETLLALANSVEAAVKQSEQAPYRRILRLIR